MEFVFPDHSVRNLFLVDKPRIPEDLRKSLRRIPLDLFLKPCYQLSINLLSTLVHIALFHWFRSSLALDFVFDVHRVHCV